MGFMGLVLVSIELFLQIFVDFFNGKFVSKETNSMGVGI